MEDEDIVKEIKKIEQAADRLIQEAQEEAKKLELASKREIEKIELASESEFEMRANRLKLGLQEGKRREELQLTARFEEEKKRLEEVDKEVLKRLVDLVAEKISEG